MARACESAVPRRADARNGTVVGLDLAESKVGRFAATSEASARFEDVPDPPHEDGPVLVQTLAVGVCGTDLEIVRGEYGWPPPGRERLVLGHDLSAVTHVQLVCETVQAGQPDWQIGLIQALRGGGYGGAMVGGGFPTGQPTAVVNGVHAGPHFPEWLPFATALFPHIDAIGLDEYAGCPVSQKRSQSTSLGSPGGEMAFAGKWNSPASRW